jgi:site-specific DNA recombinase
MCTRDRARREPRTVTSPATSAGSKGGADAERADAPMLNLHLSTDPTLLTVQRLLLATGSRRTTLPALAPSPVFALPERPAGTLRVGGYIRYSSVMQSDGYSLDAQRHAILSEAVARGNWQVAFYEEPETSAFSGEALAHRPVFLRLLSDAFSGHLDLIVVHKLDRFSRRLTVTTVTLQELERAGVGFLSIAERMDCTTPSGFLQLHLFGLLAEFYSRNLGAEIRKGKAARARMGLHIGRVPFGYRWTGEKGTAEPDVGGEWEGLLLLFRLLRAGATDLEVAEALNRDGRWMMRGPGNGHAADSAPRPFSRMSVRSVRTNRFYRPFTPGDDRGTIWHAGQEYRGLHPAAVTWEDWQRIQQNMAHHRKGWYGTSGPRLGIPYTAEFRGLAVCDRCGGRLYVWRSVHKPHTPEQIVYERYVCTARDRAITCAHDRHFARVEDVRRLFGDWLEEHFRLPVDLERNGQAAAMEIIRRRARGQERDPRQREAERARWERRLAAAKRLYLDGDLSDAEWTARRSEAQAALARLDEQSQPLPRRVDRLVRAAHVLVSAAALWRDELVTTEQRIQLATRLIEPGGLRLDLRGARGQTSRWDTRKPLSCGLTDVRLRAVFTDAADLLMTASHAG